MDSSTVGAQTYPVNSEEFLPPASCRHKRGDMEFVKSQQADRDRMVCGIGIDVHYELNVLSEETGSYQPRLRPFNPRMSGPACPYNYTGKFIGETDLMNLCDDPIELGRKINSMEPYDPALYRKHDPRKVSKTVIIRDYGCKIPITLSDTEHIARAVLNNYPDRYVDFLKEFVSNIMGEAMKKYLITYRDALRRLLDNPTDINRVSWGAYKSVQGGANSKINGKWAESSAAKNWSTDCTLPWDDSMKNALDNIVTIAGDTTTGLLTASDVFDLRPCLQQHIATLTDMSSMWCQGFATKERFALAMIWWCNEQGRHLSQDLNLLKGSDHPNYNLIELHVPTNPFHITESDAVAAITPDQDCSVRSTAKHIPAAKSETVAFRVPVGSWTGNNETPNVILNSSKSPYAWGWGHPANLSVNVPVMAVIADDADTQTLSSSDTVWSEEAARDTKNDVTMCAPFLRYEFTEASVGEDRERHFQDRTEPTIDGALKDNNGRIYGPHTVSSWTQNFPLDDKITIINQGGFKLAEYPCSIEFVRNDRWGGAFSGETDSESEMQKIVDTAVIQNANRRFNRTLRDSLGEEEDVRSTASFYRGTDDRTYGSMVGLTSSSIPAGTTGPQWKVVSVQSGAEAGPVTDTDVGCTEQAKKPNIVPVSDSCGPDGVSIIRTFFSGACRHLDPFFTNGSNCLVHSVDDKTRSDRVIDVLIRSRCFSYYNIEHISQSDHFYETLTNALSKSRKYSNRIRDIASPVELGAYIQSYKSGGNYPFRTVVPPFAMVGKGQKIPFLEMYTTPADQYRSFTEKVTEHKSVGHLNQPFLPSLAVNMNNVDWKSTDKSNNGYTDLKMNDIRDNMRGSDHVRKCMRIIAIRTVLSVMLGMDAAALICEEPIPSNRLIAFKVEGDECVLAEEGVHFTSRKSHPGLASRGMHTMKDRFEWNISEYTNGKYSVAQVNDDYNQFEIKTSSNATALSNESAMDVISDIMYSVILRRLELFMKLVNSEITDKPMFNSLYENCVPHLIRIAMISKYVSPTYKPVMPSDVSASGWVDSDERDKFGFNGYVSHEFQKTVFDSINCAVLSHPDLNSKDNNPSSDTIPYDVSFHSRVGSTTTIENELDWNVNHIDVDPNKRHESTSASLRMIESLFRDPRAFYSFNPLEWKAQSAASVDEYGKDIFKPFADLHLKYPEIFTIPYFTDEVNDSKAKEMIDEMKGSGVVPHQQFKILQNSATAVLLAHFEKSDDDDTKKLKWLDGSGNYDFYYACEVYIKGILSRTIKLFDEKSHYRYVIQALLQKDNMAVEKRETDLAYRGALPIPDKSTVTKFPIAYLTNKAGDTGFLQDKKAYFPIHPTQSFTSAPLVWKESTRAKELYKMYLPVAGPVRLDEGKTTNASRFSFIPVGNHTGYSNFEKEMQSCKKMQYNVDITRPQMFAMLDAAGLLWHARAYLNPSQCARPKITESPQCDGMHYWCRIMIETFVSSRESYRQRNPQGMWELDVKRHPSSTLPSSHIGSICDDTWHAYFPLLPFDHELRDDLRRTRALSVLWGNLTTYNSGLDHTSNIGAWMPLAPAHQMRLYNTVGLFSGSHRVPKNPWLTENGAGLSLIFNQSYHSVYHCDSYRAQHFQDWLVNANTYQVPFTAQTGCSYPFSQYGGTPVEADFIPHTVDRCTDPSWSRRHRQIVYNRFGFTSPLRIGNQFHDTGLLQDMFQYRYRAYADLTNKQRQRPEADTVHISNFLAYARTHAIIALASCNHGTEDESVPRIVRNLYRLYVDTYECMGSNTDDDSIPCVMGFSPAPINKRDDRGVVLYAGSLACLNSKLSTFCNSKLNSGERVCSMYKQVYLNDATLLYTRLLRQERRKILHDNNFNRAKLKRGRLYSREEFDRDLVDLQDAYIEFLQNTILGMLLEGDADLNGVPLHLLEPRELEVSLFQEDDNIVGNDFLTPRTKEIINQSDFGGDNLTRTQLAILSLIPPNHRILGTLRLNQSMEIIDLEHAKKQIQKETMESNKKVWQKYSEGLISAAFAQKLLEVDGPIDFSLDMSSIQDPMRTKFDMNLFKDPLKESEKIRDRMTTTHAQSSSSLSLSQRGEKMRKSTSSDGILNMSTIELKKALDLVRARVERDYVSLGGTKARVQILEMLRIPAHVRRMLRPEYEMK